MRPWLAILMIVLVTAPGCTLLDRAPKPVVAPKLATPGAPAVMPGEISAANARDKARTLNEELDRDLDGEL